MDDVLIDDDKIIFEINKILGPVRVSLIQSVISGSLTPKKSNSITRKKTRTTSNQSISDDFILSDIEIDESSGTRDAFQEIVGFKSGELEPSATIADKNKGSEEERYEYFIKNTGFKVEDGFLAVQKHSPFKYNENAMIYYVENMPHPTYERDTFIKKGIEEIIKLLKITKGKALILFTSKSDLNEVYNILKKKNIGYNLLRQSIASSQDEILEEFKKDEDSVLLATGTFWEGIDIPGKALSNLIVFRLPFPVPDPIIEYKRSTSKDFLMEVSVPYMIVKLRQGIGRLINKILVSIIIVILLY